MWALSDADHDGALSLSEFSVAMHLASCAAKKGLPVPSTLPESLAAILLPPRGGDGEKEKGVGTARRVEVTDIGRAEPNQKQSGTSADCSSAGHNEKSPEVGKRTDGLTSKTNAEVTGHGLVKAAEEESSLRNKVRNEKVMTGSGSGKTGGAAAADTENAKSSKKRELGKLSLQSSTDSPQETTSSEFGTSLAVEGGRQRKKKTKKGARAEGSDKTAVATTAVYTVKRKSSKSKRLKSEDAVRKSLTSTVTKEGHEGSRIVSTEGGQETEGRAPLLEVIKGVQRESECEENRTLVVALKNGGGVEGTAGGENGLATQSQLDGPEDGDDADAGEGAKEKTTMAKKKTSLSREERDQLYAMTTSERAGYDVVFMQVLLENYT